MGDPWAIPLRMGAGSLLATHTAAAAALIVASALGGGLASLAEAVHQALDAMQHTEAIQWLLLELWADKLGRLSFDAARLPSLVRLSGVICAGAGALCLALEGLEHLIQGPLDATGGPVVSAGVALLTLLASVAARAAFEPSECRLWSGEVRGVRGMRTLALAFAAGASGAGSGSWTWEVRAPPGVAWLAQLLVRRPDALAATLLGGLAAQRALQEGLLVASLLAQAAPPELVSEVGSRLDRVRAMPHVLAVRDVRVWAVDGHTAAGSVRIIAAVGADRRCTARAPRKSGRPPRSHRTCSDRARRPRAQPRGNR